MPLLDPRAPILPSVSSLLQHCSRRDRQLGQSLVVPHPLPRTAPLPFHRVLGLLLPPRPPTITSTLTEGGPKVSSLAGTLRRCAAGAGAGGLKTSAPASARGYDSRVKEKSSFAKEMLKRFPAAAGETASHLEAKGHPYLFPRTQHLQQAGHKEAKSLCIPWGESNKGESLIWTEIVSGRSILRSVCCGSI